MTTMTKEIKLNRGYTLSVKAKTGEVEGLFSIFGNVDYGQDRTMQGSMAQSLASKLPVFLWMHDVMQVPVAVVLEAYEISRAQLPNSIKSAYPEATGGAYVKRQYLDTSRGQELLKAIVAGSPLQMSYGYSVQDFRIVNGIRELVKITVQDISDVTYGMNNATAANLALVKGLKMLGGTVPLPVSKHILKAEAQMLAARFIEPESAKHINRTAAAALSLGIVSVGDFMHSPRMFL